MKKITTAILTLALFSGAAMAQSVKESDWGNLKSGEAVKLFTLKNKNGMIVKVSDYGAIITELHVADRNGKIEDIVIGFDNVPDYEDFTDYFGAVVGRYGNRIANGKFTLDGKEYTLPQNNHGHSLHGGTKGFDRKVWKAETSTTKDAAIIKLSLLSPDGDNGYPGNLNVQVIYTLTNNNELIMSYRATTDKPTVCNLTNHSYFNLMGDGRGSILNHEVTINADKFTPVDKGLIPTGDLDDVEGTPFDFRKPMPVGSRINADHKQLRYGGGYDHNWVLNRGADPKELCFAVRAYDPISGRQMEVYTQEPGVQFYCGNFLKNQKGKNGRIYRYRYGMCFETQHFPDSPNQKDFPSTTLRPNEIYETTTVLKFSAQ